MEPIYKCLDYLLDHLHENRFKPEGQRIPFDVDHKVMPDLGLTTHEEFIGLVDMLIEDKLAIGLWDWKMETLDTYKSRVMITPRGIDLKMKGGYTQRTIDEDAEKNRVRNIETYQLSLSKGLNMVTMWIAGGTVALVLIELWKMALEHHWFSCR